ncbi:MAG: phage minor capsid protein [Clostridia bacterium]|nr:phage minor capsid protein [Clostridia bacterium]
MLTPEQITAIRDRAGRITEPITEYLLRDVARRVSSAGQLTASASYQIERLQQMWLSRREVEKELKRLLKVSEGELKTLLTQSAEVGYRFDLDRFGVEAVPFDENESLQQIVDASVRLATDDFRNITQTIGMVDPYGHALPLQDAYQKTMDFALEKVATGTTDINTAIRDATKNLAKYGIRSIDYQSGVSRSLEAAVRGCIMGGLGLMQEQISQKNHDDMGADGWEISAHAASAPDHEPIQGKQYTDAEYTALNNSLVRRIGTLNCGHAAFPIILGVSEPQYTEEQLEEFCRQNEKGIIYQGKHYTMYEATQTQRKLERSMRTTKRKILLDEELKDNDHLLYDQIRLRRLNEEYVRFSKEAGMPTQRERAQIASYKKRASMNQHPNYMAAGKVDWSETVPIHHTDQEYAEIKAYAHSKDVAIYAIKRFDGDIDLLKEQIDVIAEMHSEYHLGKKVTITFDHSMDDNDFAMVPKRKNTRTIIFNPKTLRDRAITNRNLNADDFLAATDITGIASHEMGHLIARKYGEKGLEFAQKAYYNIYGEVMEGRGLLAFLEETVSIYASEKSKTQKDRPFNFKYYKEVLPEVLSKDATDPNSFSHEFVRLLREVLL